MSSIQYKPGSGSSYIKSPKNIENTHAVVNVQNQDNNCFLWSVAAKTKTSVIKEQITHDDFKTSLMEIV